MARVVKNKKLLNTRLATNYGGWMYCEKCNSNIGYLCYSTYDNIDLKYECNCGSKGQVYINFEDSSDGTLDNKNFVIIKNRFCCVNDQQPLITLLEDKFKNYEIDITCKACGTIFKKQK